MLDAVLEFYQMSLKLEILGFHGCDYTGCLLRGRNTLQCASYVPIS